MAVDIRCQRRLRAEIEGTGYSWGRVFPAWGWLWTKFKIWGASQEILDTNIILKFHLSKDKKLENNTKILIKKNPTHQSVYVGQRCRACKLLSGIWKKKYFNWTISLIIVIDLLIPLQGWKWKWLWIAHYLLFVICLCEHN